MRDIIKSIVTLLIASVGFIGGIIWLYQSNWDMEPLILIIVSFIEIVAYIFMKHFKEEKPSSEERYPTKIKNQQIINNTNGVKKQINIQNNKGDINL
ncbi:MAG: hypothetical protein C4539_19755 [Ignavibacteriales bacterium]|nr:MAG: hypothetical protein C4539_19755 [Ignavibacteriales bacterium]